MGATSQSPSTYQDCCIVALVSPPMSTRTWRLTFLPLRSMMVHDLPLGGVHVTQAVATSKTPWKPRVTLTAEVGDLLTSGMTEDYDCEPEISTMAKEFTTETDTSPPPKTEVPALPLDTSSQVSAPEMEASMESNPIPQFSHSSGI